MMMFAWRDLGLFKAAIFIALALGAFIFFMGEAQAAQTYVSLTFDDSRASQKNAGAILSAHGVAGTFYVNSGKLGTTPWYMTLADLNSLAAVGHEIGGHSKNHANLTSMTLPQIIDEVCGDQQQLQLWGFPAVSFAYPYGHDNATVKSVVRNCRVQGYEVNNYTSARDVGGLQCPTCLVAETHPPRDAFLVRTPATEIRTLDDMKNAVLNAEAEGGWIVIPFHSVCEAPAAAPVPGNGPDCVGNSDYVTYNDLDQFVTWLTERTGSGTSVKTVREVMETPPAPATGPNLVQNPSLEYDVDGNDIPDWFYLGGYGVNTYEFSRVSSGARSGTFAESLSVSALISGDRKLVTTNDLSTNSIFALPGKHYEASVWYRSDQPVLLELFYHDSSGWHFWEQAPYAPPSDTWTKIVWRTSRMPAGADYWMFGPALTTAGSMTVDDFNAQLINDDGSTFASVAPDIRLSTQDVRWASYSDFQQRRLSVFYAIRNHGSEVAYNVSILQSTASNGVTCATAMPVNAGHIQADGSYGFTLVYSIPATTAGFSARVKGSAQDGNAESYSY